MSESGPRWMKVATPLVTARVGQLVQNDISTCLVFQSEYHEGTRNKAFTGLGGNTVAAVGRRKFPFALAFTVPSLLNVATSITCQALLSRGSCLVMDLSVPDRCAGQVRSDQGYGKEPYFYRKQAWFLSPNVQKMPRRD